MLTQLSFLSDLPTYKVDRPYYMVENFPEIPPELHTNCRYEKRYIELVDMRPDMASFSLDTNGWEHLNHRSSVSLDPKAYLGNTYEEDTVNAYMAECVAVVQGRYPAAGVICFDWRIRKSDATDTDVMTENRDRSRQSVQTPARTVHCDYSIQGGYKRLTTHLLPEELAKVREGSTLAHFVNLWRPLSTVKTSPIFFGDPRTISLDDLIEVDKVGRDSVEFGFRVRSRHDPNQKWYWLSDQTPDEPVLFVSWKHEGDNTSITYPPHGAAMDLTSDTAHPRSSIEVRMIVLSPATDD